MAEGSAEEPLFARSIRALVVDDNDVVRRWLVRSVTRWGGQAESASSVFGAARLLVPPLDLLIADVRLPDGTSHGLFQQAAQLIPRPAMVAISGKASPAEAFRLFGCGVRAFVEKPLTGAELEVAVRQALAAQRQDAERTSDRDRALPKLLDDEFARFTNEVRLTAQQRRIVILVLEGVPRADLAASLGISENTCKSAVRRLLQRCGVDRLGDIAPLLLARLRQASP